MGVMIFVAIVVIMICSTIAHNGTHAIVYYHSAGIHQRGMVVKSGRQMMPMVLPLVQMMIFSIHVWLMLHEPHSNVNIKHEIYHQRVPHRTSFKNGPLYFGKGSYC